MAVYASLNFHINNPIILGLLLVVQIPKKCILHCMYFDCHKYTEETWSFDNHTSYHDHQVTVKFGPYFSIKLKRVALPGTKVWIFYFKSRLSLIVQVNVDLNRTVVVDSD